MSSSLSIDPATASLVRRLGHALVESLDSRETLQRMADLSVPQMADWCAIDRVREDGSYERMAVAHSDPAKVELANQLWALYPPTPEDPAGLAQVVRSGQHEMMGDLPDALLVASARSPEHLALLRGLGLRSYVVLPLVARRRTLGALTLVQAESGRQFSAEQLPMLEEFAQLIALALDNAQLYEQTRQTLESERQARQRLEQSERLQRAFIDHLPALAWTAQPDGHIDYYNQRWYEYTGTTFEDMQGWGWQKVHDPELLPLVTERWQRSIRTGEPFEMEFTLRGRDGIPRWFLTRVAPMRDAAGKILRWFGTNTEIDAIRQALALSEAMRQQSAETAEAMRELQHKRERAEQRAAEIEATARREQERAEQRIAALELELIARSTS